MAEWDSKLFQKIAIGSRDMGMADTLKRFEEAMRIKDQINRLEMEKYQIEGDYQTKVNAKCREIMDLQAQCPHSAVTYYHGAFSGDGFEKCDVCGEKIL